MAQLSDEAEQLCSERIVSTYKAIRAQQSEHQNRIYANNVRVFRRHAKKVNSIRIVIEAVNPAHITFTLQLHRPPSPKYAKYFRKALDSKIINYCLVLSIGKVNDFLNQQIQMKSIYELFVRFDSFQFFNNVFVLIRFAFFFLFACVFMFCVS